MAMAFVRGEWKLGDWEVRDSHQEAQWPAGELPGSRAEASTATSDEGRRRLLEDLQLHMKTHPPDSAHKSQIWLLLSPVQYRHVFTD